MDTKEKRRESPRQRGTGEERRTRHAQPENARRNTQQKRPARSPEDARRTADRQPVENPARQKSARRTEERPASAPQRPAQSGRKPARTDSRQTRPARNVASIERPGHSEGEVRFAAPQGLGPRKSAPKMSEQEAAAHRRQQQNRRPAQEQKKKNSLQNFISGIRDGGNSDDAATKAEQRRKQRAAKAEKKKRQAQRYDTPAVIYTQPKVFNRDKLLLQLLTVTAVVAAFVVGMSVFFKVETITVSGAETYDTWTVRQASGINEGDNLLTFSKAKASAKIQAELGYVDDVRIGIKLPGTVIIYIEEVDVSYAIRSDKGDMWLINSDGKVVKQINSVLAADYTNVEGVLLDNPVVGTQAVASDRTSYVPQEETQPVDATGETQAASMITVTGAQRLSSALQILKALEANDIVGEATSIDVSELEDITLEYGSQYEVLLGDAANMEYKIACMNDAILQMSDYQAGILDVSFRTWTTQVGYTPFG